MTYNKSLNIVLTMIFYSFTITNNIVDSNKTINSGYCLVCVIQHISVDVSKRAWLNNPHCVYVFTKKKN